MTTPPSQTQSQHPTGAPRLEDRTDIDYEFGALDLVFGLLTLPLLFWALMYAVTGHEHIYATRRARMRLYALLFVLQIVIAALIFAYAKWLY